MLQAFIAPTAASAAHLQLVLENVIKQLMY